MGFRLCLVVALIASLSGCGGANERYLAPVSGTVRYRGQPLANANVAFVPDENEARAASGITDSEGRYRLTTFEVNDGARIGSHRVTVRAVEIAADAKENPRPINLPPPKIVDARGYNVASTSGLTAEVVAGKNNVSTSS